MTDMTKTRNMGCTSTMWNRECVGAKLSLLHITCVEARLVHIGFTRLNIAYRRGDGLRRAQRACPEARVRVIGSAKASKLRPRTRHAGTEKQTETGSLDAKSEGHREYLTLSHGAAKNHLNPEDAVREPGDSHTTRKTCDRSDRVSTVTLNTQRRGKET